MANDPSHDNRNQQHHHQQQQHQQQPSSGFWTLTRPSKLSKRRNSDLHELHHKVFNISVVGLSGVEKDKGPIGIGKSCLCNRFVRSASDDYHTDHISVLSQSDFSGRVVNNDHWLYWGSVIKSCDGYDLAFNIIEQSEFVDDACFQPFKSGKTEPYFKRCANTKLVSAEKLMYICKNQLGIEREYEQRYLPDGKFNVDGFLCLFDVSEVQGRNIDKQIEITNLIMLNLMKTRKPIVFVTTKHDEASELLVIEAERLINQRDFRGIVPIVETSAQENININMAFLVCAQLIDKTRTKLRVPPYFEAHKNHQDLLNAASEAYLGLIRSTVLDYRTSWQQVCIKLSHNPEFLQYTYLHGLDKAMMFFNNHLKRLRDEWINLKVGAYVKLFGDVLNELVPSIDSLKNISRDSTDNAAANSTSQLTTLNWETTKEKLFDHPLFSKYFIQIPEGIAWYETELLQSTENRIPSDWLNSDEAYAIFHERNMALESEIKRRTTRDMFAQLLNDIKVPVGKPFIELKHLFTGNPDFSVLNDQELFDIYVDYQNNLLQKARADFQELLLENAEHLQHLTTNNKVIRQEDIKTINTILQHDERYQALDRFDQDRTLMMIRHLSFLHSQISEQCPSYPKCVEPEIERLLITKAKSLVSQYFESKPNNKQQPNVPNQPPKTCDLIIFGPRRPSQQLILALNVLNSRTPKESQYQITFTVFDNPDEVDAHVQKFRQSNSEPKGCFGIFTNQRSLEYVSYTLEKFLILSSQIQDEKNYSGSPPIVMLYAADITLDERTMLALENEGQQLADKFRCPFMNVTAIDQYRQHQQNNILTNEQDSTSQVMSECASLDYACVDAAFNVLKEAVSRRVCFMELYNNQDLIPRQAFNPDARILMCLLCGEPFSNELFMWKMFLNYDDCYVTSSKSICLRVKLDSGQEKFIEVIITSYTHGAFNYREDLLHGFILVCSIQRRASISILNAFSFNIPCTPVLVMAIKSDSRPSTNYINNQQPIDNNLSEQETKLLINETQTTTNRLKGYFKLLNLSNDVNRFHEEETNPSIGLDNIQDFLCKVIKSKPIIERAYELGDSNEMNIATMSSFDRDYPVVRQRWNDQSTTGGSGSQSKVHIDSDDNLKQEYKLKALDKNMSSDDSESYATIPPNLGTFSEREEPPPSFSELYASRPLPPIPSSTIDHCSESERHIIGQQSTVTNLTGSGDNKQSLPAARSKKPTTTTSSHSSTEIPQATSNNDISSTDDDTEDSADNKHEKPIPGKLDLSQFDNITNAIGKLKVQPTKTRVTTSENQSKSSSSSNKDNSTSHESGFFKNRSKKSKTKSHDTGSGKSLAKDPPIKLQSTTRLDKQKSLDFRASSTKTPQTAQTKEQQRQPEVIRIHPKNDSAIHRKYSDERDEARSGIKKEKSSQFQSKEPILTSLADMKQGKVASIASTFLQQQSETTTTTNMMPDDDKKWSDKPLPKPAPRLGTVASGRHIFVEPTTSPSTSSFSASNVPTSNDTPTSSISSTSNTPTSSTTTTSVSGVKRMSNIRQNHGRAVAPPQLPPSSGDHHINMMPLTSSDLPHNDSVKYLSTKDNDDSGSFDINQSPIGHRLLHQYSRDYKVSELNSPHESDSESSVALKSYKLQRGQSSNSDTRSSGQLFANSSIDSSELINSRGAAIRQLNEILANKQPAGRLGATKRSSSNDICFDNNQEQAALEQLQQSTAGNKKNDKDNAKKDKKKSRDDEKMEKRRQKEEERIKRQEKKLAAKKSKSGSAGQSGVGDDGIPLFIKKCIEFIELEGLDAEGIYRVPGNRAHVDAFVQKFKDNPDMSIVESDIPVNAVATALKDFLSKKWGPIIPVESMNELTEFSNISQREERIEAIRQLIKKLPQSNYNLLKYVFSHFVKVSLNHSLNSMDSKNLAICWWPTLLPLHFNDMVMFEQMRPHLEESIQTMIDQYDLIFNDDLDSSTSTSATTQ